MTRASIIIQGTGTTTTSFSFYMLVNVKGFNKNRLQRKAVIVYSKVKTKEKRRRGGEAGLLAGGGR